MKLSVVLSLLFLSRLALAEFPLFDEPSRKFQQNLWDFQSQLTSFQTTDNYTKEGGMYQSLPAGASYQLMSLDLGLHYGLSQKWGAYATSQIARAESKNGSDSRNNSSLTQIGGGMDYLLYHKGSTELFVDGSLLLPLKKVETQGNEVLNSEGALELAARLIGRQSWRSFHFFASTGLIHRDEGRSGLLPYALGAEWRLTSLNLGGELRGFQTILNDQYSDDPERRQVVAPRNGGSWKFYSVNPSLLESHFWLRSNSSSAFQWKVGAGATLTGTSTAAGWNLFAGLSFSSDQASQQPEFLDKTIPSPSLSKPDVHQFEEDVRDEEVQKYFYPPKTPAPAPAAPKPATPKPRSEKIQKKKIQPELNQSEFQIQLKRKKKPSQKKRPG